jgi:DNA-binding response OmpR family regulator
MTRKVLIIDDEEDICFFLSRNLTSDDLAVEYATTSDKGLLAARTQRPDLIVLDINMPKKDGFAVLEELKKDKRTLAIPVIMLTAYEHEEYKSKAVELYAEYYLTKPVTAAELKAKIDAVLARQGKAGAYKEEL